MLPILLAFTMQVTGNFPRDLYGPKDTRNATWGHSEADSLPIVFRPPVGYRVKILRLRGDLVSWPKIVQPDRNFNSGGFTGVLMGFSTTANDGSVLCNWCADNTVVYVQDGFVGMAVRRTPFDWTVDRLLERDHTLVLKIASYLNTLGVPIHIEATWSAEFEYVKEP
jgi:hypothetical protein